MKHNVEYFKKYYINATKEEVIEDMFLDCCEQAKEIERLKEDNKYLNKVNIELSTEKNRLNNIINEAIELTNKIIEAGWDYDEKDSLAIKLEEILKDSDKEK